MIRSRRSRWSLVNIVMGCTLMAALLSVATHAAQASSPKQLDLKVLLVGGGPGDPTTVAWRSALAGEGVPYTLVSASGSYGSETVGIPALTSGSTGNFNGVVIADSPAAFGPGVLSDLFSYESAYDVRQLDGYTYPSVALGITDASAEALDGTTAQLTAAGRAGLPGLKGTLAFDTGTYGYPATPVAGAPFAPWLENAAGQVLAGVYQHPSGDPQAGVSELELTFDYNASQLQWLLLAPGAIDWVTSGTHLGLYRNYFGQDIDDNFIADNSWSSQYQCTPGATDPPDYTCPAGVANNPADTPADVQMSAADVAYVVGWEQRTGIPLNLAFNGVGACTAPTTSAETSANCTGSITEGGTTYTDPGQAVDPSYPNDAGLIDALLAHKSDFNWINHTWSHQFLGCVVWQPQAVSSATAEPSGGSMSPGSYAYEVSAATAYGESEPSVPLATTVTSGGSVRLSWPDATNGIGTDGSAGPTLAQEEAVHTGGSGFWGYDIYRQNPGTTTFGLVGQVPEDPTGKTATYSFTDAGSTAPGAAPGSSDAYPTATNPGIDCSSAPGSWDAATSTSPDASIEQEIGYNQAFATANGLPNFDPSALVTGEHSGIENPNIPAALAGTGIKAFAADASRQPVQYAETSGTSTAESAPRYPSNIYYNASNWPDELNEYNTLYVEPGVPVGNPSSPSETGHCQSSAATTCIATPATESSVLASESRIMLTHVLGNDPRVGYAHQSDLIGPATQTVGGLSSDYGYTILTLIDDMLRQYNAWSNDPLIHMTDTTEAQTLGLQTAWSAAEAAGSVSATETNGVVSVTNTDSRSLSVPLTVPLGTTVGGTAFGQAYGGQLSGWTNLPTGGMETLTENVAPTITSAGSATAIVGSPFSTTVTTTGFPAATLTESGALPAGITFTDNGDGTGTLAGTSKAGSGGTYPMTITAKNPLATTAQTLTLTVDEAPTITSPRTASFAVGLAGTYSVTTTGFPEPTITVAGPLPPGITFADHGDGTATLAGTASGAPGTYPVVVSATNASGSTASLALSIQVSATGVPVITNGSTAYFTLDRAGAFAVVAGGTPVPAITESGTLPPGLTFLDEGSGTALVSGTPTVTGSTPVTITATNPLTTATQTLTIQVASAPAITSPTTVTASTGTALSFPVTTSGFPAPVIGESGALPAGISFIDHGNGTAALGGTPASGTGGSYPLTLTAVNAAGTTTQTLILTVHQAPGFTSAASATGAPGAPLSFAVSATGAPAPVISETGVLPAGVTFTGGANGTAALGGTPASGTGGSYPLTLTATNAAGTTTQTLTLTVLRAPVFTNAPSVLFKAGTASAFAVTTTGAPAATLSETGVLPAGVTFVAGPAGTANLFGTPAAGTARAYPLTLTATNAAGTVTQAFTLQVGAPPTITSPAVLKVIRGTQVRFAVTSTGFPAATIGQFGSLPPGLTLVAGPAGTATITGMVNPKAPPTNSTVFLVAFNNQGWSYQVLSVSVR